MEELYEQLDCVSNNEMVRTTGEHHSMVQLDIDGSFELIKAQIANHPLYPDLLSLYLDCKKVGAPPELMHILEEISQENQSMSSFTPTCMDPELDEFMQSYCETLRRLKDELSKPVKEAAIFLSTIESQLSDLCKETLTMDYHSEKIDGEDSSNYNRLVDVKKMLMDRYSGYLGDLKKEFFRNRKNGKLPKEAVLILLEWWDKNCKWPYPTEEEKVKLSDMTGLDQKQINNWFINQRKRHWKPSEDMKFALLGIGKSTGKDQA